MRVRPCSQVEAVFGVQRHDTNGHVAEIDQLSHLATSIKACVRCVTGLLAVRRLRSSWLEIGAYVPCVRLRVAYRATSGVISLTVSIKDWKMSGRSTSPLIATSPSIFPPNAFSLALSSIVITEPSSATPAKRPLLRE